MKTNTEIEIKKIRKKLRLHTLTVVERLLLRKNLEALKAGKKKEKLI